MLGADRGALVRGSWPVSRQEELVFRDFLEMVIPLSTGYTCPVTIRDLSDARNTAMLAISSGSISPIRCAARDLRHSRVARFKPPAHTIRHHRGWCDRITRTFCGANSTAIDRVIAAMPPFAAV